MKEDFAKPGTAGSALFSVKRWEQHEFGYEKLHAGLGLHLGREGEEEEDGSSHSLPFLEFSVKDCH